VAKSIPDVTIVEQCDRAADVIFVDVACAEDFSGSAAPETQRARQPT
jgi:hypothetical protein